MALELITGNAVQKLVLEKVEGLIFSFVPLTISPVTKCWEGNSSLTEQCLQTRLTPSNVILLTFGSDNLGKGLEDLFEHKSVINQLFPGSVLSIAVCRFWVQVCALPHAGVPQVPITAAAWL